MPAIQVIRNLHDGFDKDGQPIFYKAGSVYDVDEAFVKKWENKKIPAIKKAEAIKLPENKEQSKKTDKK